MNFATAYDPFRALKAAWELLKKAPATILVGGVLLSITDGGCSGGNQFVSDGGRHYSDIEVAAMVMIVIAVLVLAVGAWLFSCLLKVGFPTAVEKVHNSDQEQVGAIFKSEGRWLNMVVATFLQMLALFAAVVPMLLVVGFAALVAAAADSPAVGFAIGGAGFLVWLPFFIYIALGLGFIPLAVALERLNPIEAFGRSWGLVRGNRLQLLLFHIVTTIFTLLGLLACCVGVLFTSALTYTANADAYLRLVRSREEQVDWVARG